MAQPQQKTAVLYRMVMPDHICPFGLKSLHRLKKEGYEVEDHHLTTREETDAFLAEHDVKTTPQTFIDGYRVGGYEDLKLYFGAHQREPGETTLVPVMWTFILSALAALAFQWGFLREIISIDLLINFVGLAMVSLAMLKLQNLRGFTNRFLGYDLLAQRWVTYAYIYPFAEALAGLLMIGGVLVFLGAPIAIFIGTIGAVSVIKAVYIDKRELKCACVGGDTNVPLGIVSLTENLMMAALGLFMLGRAYFL